MPNQYEKTFKQDAVKRYENGESVSAISENIHVPVSTLYRWIQTYRTIETSHRKYSPVEFEALLKRARKAEHLL